MFAQLLLPGMLWKNIREEARYLWFLQGSSFLVEVLNQTLPPVPFLSSITTAQPGVSILSYVVPQPVLLRRVCSLSRETAH